MSVLSKQLWAVIVLVVAGSAAAAVHGLGGPVDVQPRRLADGRIAIDRPTTITEPGSYVVTRNIGSHYMSFVPTISVSVDHVTIDLNGFTLSGQEPAILAENVLGLTIRNGLVSSADQAVRLDNVTNFVLRDLTIQNGEDPSIVVTNGARGHIENVATVEHVEISCEGCLIIHNRFSTLGVLGDGNFVDGNSVHYIDH